MVSYNGQSCVYDVMGNPTTYRGKAATWTNGRRLASFDGHTFTYDGQGRRLTKDNVVFTYDSNGRLIKQGDNMEFFYDQTGVVGLKYGVTTYLYRKDVQGNVIALIGENGAIVARYLYDAWGNVSVVDNNGTLISDVNHIGNLNPFRYRSYYYDTETKLYFLKTRYYDAEIGRFMTIDGIEYLNPETINGLNLYAYCNNNPVMNIDPNGNKWWRWVVAAVAVVGITVATVFTAGAAAVALGATVATVNAVMVGAAVGGLIAGGTNLVMQGLASDWQTVDYGSLALSTFVGGASGAISAGFGQLSTGVVSGTRLLAHKGFQTAVNTIISGTGYVFSSAISGKEVTLDGLMFATLGGFISGVTFNWGAIPALGLLIGLEVTGYTKDIIDYIRNFFKNVQ